MDSFFKVHYAADARGRASILKNFKLNWYDQDKYKELSVRAYCRLKVRLKVPHGQRNPGTFDRGKWLFIERVSATGYIVQHPSNHCTEPVAAFTVSSLRRHIGSSIRTLLPNVAQNGIVAALAVADREGLSDHQWAVFRATGTAHLLAIFGLHISLVDGIAFFLAHWLIGLVAPHNRRWSVQRPAAVVAFLVALAYAALAGFPTSTQRALVMFAVA